MDCLKQYPWVTATVIAVLLSLLFGFIFQLLQRRQQRNPYGYVLGICEAIIFMATFAFGIAIGAAWLAFKVASKWQSWSILAKAKDPEVEKLATVEEISRQYHNFLVGTAANIIVGLAAWAAGKALDG